MSSGTKRITTIKKNGPDGPFFYAGYFASLPVAGAGAHLVLSLAAVFGPPAALFGGILLLDALGGLFLLLTSVLFFAAAIYAKLIAAADSGPPASQAVTLSLSSDGERFFGALRIKSRVMVETMNVYQRLIFALLPEPTQ